MSHQKHFDDLLLSFFADKPTQSVTDSCLENVRFDEPNNRGPFRIAGREYIREPLDAWSDYTITDQVEVFGSQAGKTAKTMAGVAWTIQNNPSRIFWVMPTRDTVIPFARDRLIPMMEASPGLKDLIPTGAEKRTKFSTRSQALGGSIVSLVWSNSPSALAGTPAPIVILDEVDKFNEGTKREANAVNLADQRTKGQTMPKRIKSSTPTLVSGLIWQEFLKTDQRRRFLPCPFCAKLVTFAWSENYTVFPKTGSEAYIRWDQGAKKPDGTWDLDRVFASTHALCPHCKGHIQDASKTKMDREGVWMPTAKAARGYRGWHLSSLYVAGPETSWGRLAVKFLQAKNSIQGLQGFINGDLAEPYQAQDTMRRRTEVVSEIEVTAEWIKMLTADCQFKAPYFRVCVRAWNGGNSKGIEYQAVDTWEDIRARQEANKISDKMVIVDSGFGAKGEIEVYRTCARFGGFVERQDARPMHMGWLPSKGNPSRKRWKDEDTGLMVPYYLRSIDPFTGLSTAGQVEMSLFEFAADYFKDVLQNLRDGKTEFKWEVSPEMASEQYWREMDGEVKKTVHSPKTGLASEIWTRRSKHWPNEALDCENLQIAYADFLRLFQV